MLEPDANGRRLVTTAATDRSVESLEFNLNEPSEPAVKTYDSGREQLRSGDTSLLWHPVPGRDGQLGVLGVGWSHQIKRMPDTLAPVMEALAAEAAGVIERTTLLLKLETAVKVDDATGLPNERAWEEEVPRELSQARRQGTPLSVVILDLGEFELTPEGKVGTRDRNLLRSAADGWRKELNPNAFLAHRVPPGRFSALLPEVGADEAQSTARRLQSAAPDGRHCAIAVATWNGLELPAALVERAETQIELERAASRAD